MTSGAEQKREYKLQLGEDVDRLGLHIKEAIVEIGPNPKLRLYNGKIEPFEVNYGKTLYETVNAAKKALIDSHEFDGKEKELEVFSTILAEQLYDLKEKLLKELAKKVKVQQTKSRRKKKQQSATDVNVDQELNDIGVEIDDRSDYEKAQEAKILKIKADVEKIRSLHIGISVGAWRDGLAFRYKQLKEVVEKNVPEVWPALEFTLASHRILNILDCTLPLIGILLARPGSCKTVTLNLMNTWMNTFYTDTFSPKAWVTHTTAVDSEEQLKEIDMLPMMRNKHFLTPELAPILTIDEKILNEILGNITRIADGDGLSTHSGAHGHRAYDSTMFVWTGAAVDIPYKVYKMLGTLGFKIYFFRLPYTEKDKERFLANLKENFNIKRNNIASALYEYLGWFEIGPDLIYDEGSGLRKMEWDYQNDEEQALKVIVDLGILLSHLRCIAQTWDTKDTQGSNYDYHHSQPEDPARAMEVLKNIARGHALLLGRNYITLEDIPIVIKTALSTALIDRVGLLYSLIENKGTMTTEQVTVALKVSKKTALRYMTEFWVVGLVNILEKDVKGTVNNPPYKTKSIELKSEFNWLLDKDFKKLSEDFKPVDYRAFMKEKEKTDGDVEKADNKPSSDQLSIFWQAYFELEASNPTEMDKGTISKENLHDKLVDTGKFSQDSAYTIIDYMKSQGSIEEIDDWLLKRVERRDDFN